MSSRKLMFPCVFACLTLCAPLVASAAERQVTSLPVLHFGESAAKAAGDTIDLMGPGGLYPYRGDFETADARPGGEGLLPDGWTSLDEMAAPNHWHVDNHGLAAPLSGKFAWCGSLLYDSCGTDAPGGYGNNWLDILEFRKTVGGAATVRVRADLVHDTEPGYDFVYLQRRTSAHPDFEPVSGGQGQAWDGIGTVAVDYIFNYAAGDLYQGTDIAVAFVFDSDGAWSDADCDYPSNGAARVDNLIVTLDGATYTEDFEDGSIGPDWKATADVGVGDFARVWVGLGNLDPCAVNYSKVVAFIDDGLVVPGTGGTVGTAGNDYGPPGGYIVNNTGGLLGPSYHLQNSIYSPVMDWPDPAKGGMSLAFDVYRHEVLLAGDSPGIFYTWSIRSAAAGQDIEFAGWQDRAFVYYGGPNYQRAIHVVDDLIVSQPTRCQVMMGVYELGWLFGYGEGTNGTPAPYFDNVRVKVYSPSGPRILVTEYRLANDGFPASGVVDAVNLGANSIRFDMAANIAARSHLRNDPGDSIYIDVTPRMGGTLDMPVMYWTFAVQNPLFDPYRALPANPVVGKPTRNAGGNLVANRFNFDLPDTGMIFPGDVLHYYFSATDHVAGDTRTSTAPGAAALAGFGDPALGRYPGLYTVNGLPTDLGLASVDPWPHTVLFWNDAGFREHEIAWHSALGYSCLAPGEHLDVFNTHAPAAGVGNGLGGRATVAQLANYRTILYTSGDLSLLTLSNGDFNADPGDDIGLLQGWLALGNRNLVLMGDDLAASLQASGAAGQAFLGGVMGATLVDGDIRDQIGGQVSPKVVRTEPNPVFATTAAWAAYGGCPGINDFDGVVPAATATRLAQFTAPDGASTPYPYAAAILNATGTNQVVSMNHDLGNVLRADYGLIVGGASQQAPPSVHQGLLRDILDAFDARPWFCEPTSGADLPDAAARFSVSAHPNPFNPSVAVDWTLPRPGRLTVKVYDMRGALVRTLHDAVVSQTAGRLAWDGRDDADRGVPSGLYFVESRADGAVDVLKVTLLR